MGNYKENGKFANIMNSVLQLMAGVGNKQDLG
jgi:hypothetical protein